MMRALLLLLFLGFCWISLSGHYTPLLLVLGALSCLIVLWFSHKMDLVDHEDHPLHLHPLKLLSYWAWLCVEVIKSNIDVARRIAQPDMPLRPQLITVPTSQKTELGQVIYANSITLTPGTVAINLHGHEIEVHALAQEPVDALLTGDMDRRVTAVERPRPEDPRAGAR